MARSPENGPEKTPESASVSRIEEQIKKIEGMSSVMGSEPDLSDVWQSEEFLALAPEEQSRIRTAHGAAAESEAEAAPAAEKPSAEARVEAPESRTEKRGQKPKTWLFLNYVLKRDPSTGAFSVSEVRAKYDERKKRYEQGKNPLPTAITLPEQLAALIDAEPEFGEKVIAACEKIRKRLDEPGERGGLKIVFDDGQPKWKYSLDGAVGRDRKGRRPRKVALKPGETDWQSGARAVASADEMPKNVSELAAAYWSKKDEGQKPGPQEEYWRQPLWRDWYGKAIQRKREDIISGELGRLSVGDFEAAAAKAPEAGAEEVQVAVPEARGEEPQAAVEPEAPSAEAVPSAEPAPEAPAAEAEAEPAVETEAAPAEEAPSAPAEAELKEQAESGLTTEKVGADAEPIVDKLLPAFQPLYTLPKDKLLLVKRVTQSAAALLNDIYRKEGVADAADKLNQTAYIEAVVRAVVRRLNGESGEHDERREAESRFFAEHQGLDRGKFELTPEGGVSAKLDKYGGDAEKGLSSAVKDLVADAVAGETGRGAEEAAARISEVIVMGVKELAKRDIIEYDERAGRLTITDPGKFTEIIRRRFRKLTGKA